MFGVVELVGGGLINRYRNGVGGRVRAVSGVQHQGFGFQGCGGLAASLMVAGSFMLGSLGIAEGYTIPNVTEMIL
jgi:hypothetical protein